MANTEEQDYIKYWREVWIRPRGTINLILQNRPSLLIILLLVFVGAIYNSIGQAELRNDGDRKEIGDILLNSVLFRGLIGLLAYGIFIWGANLCSSWLGGVGNFRKTLTAFAWSMVPFTMGLILIMTGYLFFRNELFTSETPNIKQDIFLNIAYRIYIAIKVVLGVWNIMLMVLMISEVQNFSIWKSISCLVLGLLVVILPFAIIALLTHPELWVNYN